MNTPRTNKAAQSADFPMESLRESQRLETELSAVTKELADAQADIAAEIAQGEIYKAERDAAIKAPDDLSERAMAVAFDKDELIAERGALLRGEYVCKKCGVRKDGEGAKGDF